MRGGRFGLVLLALVALCVQSSVQANRVLLRSLSNDPTNTLQPDDGASARFVELNQVANATNTTSKANSTTSSNSTAASNASTSSNTTKTNTTATNSTSAANATSNATAPVTNTTQNASVPVIPDPHFFTTKIHIGCGRVMTKCQYTTEYVTTNFKSVPNVTSHHSCCDLGASDRKWEKFSYNSVTKECQLFSQRLSTLQCSSDKEFESTTNGTVMARRAQIDQFVSGKPDAACRAKFQAEWQFNVGTSGPAYNQIATFGDTADERECCARCVYDERCDFFNVYQSTTRCVLWSKNPRVSSVLDSEREKLVPAKDVIAGQFTWA